VAVAALFALPQCKTRNANPNNSADAPAASSEDLSTPSPSSIYNRITYVDVEYFYRGVTPTRHSLPFERCTREGDYMILTKRPEAHHLKPVLGMRIYINEKTVPDIDKGSFVAYQDGKLLSPEILHYENDKVWLAEVTWELDPHWKVIRIDQDIFGLDGGKRVRGTSKFQAVIQDGGIDWSVVNLDDGMRGARAGIDPCPP
jgi:hypothetical protein